MTSEKRIITPERRAELAEFVGFFEVLMEEDKRQKLTTRLGISQ